MVYGALIPRLLVYGWYYHIAWDRLHKKIHPPNCQRPKAWQMRQIESPPTAGFGANVGVTEEAA
jgi:hypothetical protein